MDREVLEQAGVDVDECEELRGPVTIRTMARVVVELPVRFGAAFRISEAKSR